MYLLSKFMKSYLIVKSYVPKKLIDDFDHWYSTEHLKDAHKEFKAINSFRGWSKINKCIHYAYYQFKSLDEATDVLRGNSLKKMIEIYDLRWKNMVKRERDISQISEIF